MMRRPRLLGEKAREALMKIFGMNDKEAEILMELGSGIDARELSERTGLAIPSVNRYLNSLIKLGLAKRSSMCCVGSRGRYYVYSSIGKDELKKKMLAELKRKCAEMREIIKGF